jgi:hypothetical protein
MTATAPDARACVIDGTSPCGGNARVRADTPYEA